MCVCPISVSGPRTSQEHNTKSTIVEQQTRYKRNRFLFLGMRNCYYFSNIHIIIVGCCSDAFTYYSLFLMTVTNASVYFTKEKYQHENGLYDFIIT